MAALPVCVCFIKGRRAHNAWHVTVSSGFLPPSRIKEVFTAFIPAELVGSESGLDGQVVEPGGNAVMTT